MKKRFLSLLCVLALCLGLLPVTAEAAEGAPSSLYVGNQQVISGSDITYWTTDESTGGLTKYEGNNDNWNVKYDQSTATLTLKNANISGSFHQYDNPHTAGIYAQGKSNQPVALTIELIGTNTITGTYGIFLNAEINASSYGTDASLTITSENNGSLQVSGSNHGIYVKSGSGDASLNIKNVAVTSSTNGNYAAGVYVMSSNYATNSPNISLSVDGGSLTASGTGNSDGILFYVGQSQATGATTSLTITNHAIVDARNGGISASRISETLPTPTPTGNNSSGIVFDGTKGTVYGEVELQNDLEIKSGETLTIPDGSTLDTSGKLTNNGTILVETGGTVSGNLSGGTAVTTPSITAQPTGQTVTEGTQAAFSVSATAGSETPTYQWQQSTDSGSNWTDISDATANSYTINSTTTSMSGYQYRCVVKSASGVGVISNAATLTVTEKTEPTTYTISTAEQLYAFANAVNEGNTTANAVLTADITLTGENWTPIGKENACMYEGTFDGQGHTISGLHCSVSSGDVAGLFGVIGSSGVVKNVGIADSSVVATTGQDAYAGGVCGWNTGTIQNCYNTGEVSGTGTSSYGHVYAGGVCGWNTGTIENCYNTGDVSGTGTSSYGYVYAGGVCGWNTGTIENCYNTGEVSGTGTSSYGYVYAGGVCGWNEGTIENCWNSSSVSATANLAYAGGVCGWNQGGTIRNCWNSGSVNASSSNNDLYSGAYAGGVCGWNQWGTIRNCWNSGSVSANSSSSTAYAGGVCGRNQGGTIRNCWNSGSVNASSSNNDLYSGAYAGGVCGWNEGTVENCWNSGSVSANSSSSTAYAGGVCGDSTGSIENCYWLDTACSTGVGAGRPTTDPDVESKTTDEFASGEVAWLLNEPQTEKPWGQGSNGMPVLKGNLPDGATSYVPVRITIVMQDNSEQYRYTTEGSTVAEYPTGYAFFFKDGDTKTWISKGTQTYDSDTTIYAETMPLEKIQAKAPTCTEDGNSAYWYSAAFDKYFKDENGVNEITAESTVIPAKGHGESEVKGAKEATCTEEGYTGDKVCKVCGEILERGTVIEKLGHVWGEPEWNWSEDGTSCTVTFTCKNNPEHKETPEADVTSEVKTPATCTETGVTTYTATVEFNGNTYTDTKEVADIPATGHSYGKPEWNWSEDGKTCTVTFTCEKDENHKESPKVDVTSAVKKPATCTEAGVTTYTATVEFNGKTYTDTKDLADIPATGHSYGEPVWNWSEDGKTCTVTFTCEKDETHKETPKVIVTSAEKTPGTCTEAGVTTYTATVEFNGKTYTDTKEVADIPATGHSYDNGKCTVCGAIASDFKVIITAGANGSWQKGTKDGLTFTSNAAYKHFQKVQVDGKDLDASNYTVKEGSTIVTLKAEYLETLSVGKHTLAIVSETGTATTEFTVKAAAVTDDTQSPQTGDDSNIALWIAVLLAAGTALTGTAVYSRKRKYSK